MQLIIDTNNDSPRELRAAADMLTALAGPAYYVDAQRPTELPDAPVVALEPCDTTPPPPVAEPETAADVFTQALPVSTPTDAPAPIVSGTTPTESASSAPTSTVSDGAGVELDADGLPWDARIHASSKTRNADGRWRQKRGVHEALVTSVTEQLQAVMAVPSASTPAPVEAPAGAPTPPPAMETPQPAVAAFPALMQKITAAQTSGRLTPAAILDAVRSAGLNALPELIHRPDLISGVDAYLNVLLLEAAQ